MKSRSSASPRVKRVWDRLTEWYGESRMLALYPDGAPRDWCRAIDATDNTAVKRALSIVRSKHVEFPPTFPQFVAALKPLPVEPQSGPTTQEKLCGWVAHKVNPQVVVGTMPPRQFSQPWTYLFREFATEGKRGCECTGVVIPALGDSPQQIHRVTDMQAAYDLTEAA